jgi:hypothetical protein
MSRLTATIRKKSDAIFAEMASSHFQMLRSKLPLSVTDTLTRITNTPRKGKLQNSIDLILMPGVLTENGEIQRKAGQSPISFQ